MRPASVSQRFCTALAGLLLVALLSNCVTSRPPTPAAPAPAQAEYPADLQGARLYRLAPEQSRLHILVYRGGSMAQLGHNHVISSSTLSGYVWLNAALEHSGFSITMPVNDLIVDDPQARLEEGTDFSANVTDAARAGTKANMLKPEQLDGEHYPAIRLRSMSISGTRDQPQLQVQITIRDQTRETDVPVQLATIENTLRVTGEFTVRQTDFGITPYSVALGALLVQDQLTIKFELVALR